jgi:hypothetical protein
MPGVLQDGQGMGELVTISVGVILADLPVGTPQGDDLGAKLCLDAATTWEEVRADFHYRR